MTTSQQSLSSAFMHYRNGQLDAARHLAENLCSDAVIAGPAHQLLGMIALKQNAANAATSHFTQALQILGEDAGLLQNLAAALRRAGEPEAAVEHLRRAVELAPNHAGAWFNLGNCEAETDQYEAAKSAYETALALAPDYTAAAWNLASLMQHSGADRMGVIQAYQRVVAHDNRHHNAHKRLADLLREQGDIAGALQHYKRAAALEPQNAETRAALANATAELGSLDEAEAHYLQAIELGASAGLWSNLAWVRLERGHLDEARTAITHALALDPHHVGAHYHKSLLALEEGHPQAALQAVETALRNDPQHVRSHAVLGLALERLGRIEDLARQFDYTHLIGQFTLSGVAGNDGTATPLLEALATIVRDDATLMHNRPNRATRGGSQTLTLGENIRPGSKEADCLTAFERYILQGMKQYLRDIDSARYPYFQQPPPLDACTLVMWGVVLEASGYQNPHNHPSGLISGVCYVDVPAAIQEGNEEGWIEFGASNVRDEQGHYVLGQHTRRFRPIPGRFLIFPSYFWHRTIPYTTPGQRICIAFDLLPPKTS